MQWVFFNKYTFLNSNYSILNLKPICNIEFSDAPDILMDMNAMRSSIKINTWPLRHLSCSKTENCLTKSAYTSDAYTNPKTNTRRLMVFTSLILNKGTAAFRPNMHKDQWEWHQCHKHFHSMEYFARYDLIGNFDWFT